MVRRTMGATYEQTTNRNIIVKKNILIMKISKSSTLLYIKILSRLIFAISCDLHTSGKKIRAHLG